MSGQAGRPKDVPYQTADKYTYARLGDRLIVYPSDVVQSDEEELIKSINTGYNRGITTILTAAQHKRLQRILQHYLL